MNFLKETESQYKQSIKQVKSEKVSSHLYKIKQIVKRITIEGEHTCLMLQKHDQTMASNSESLCLEIIPIMNAPYQKQTLTLPLSSFKIVHIYRYLFQYKTLRIVTEKSEEYLFEFQKSKHAQKAYDILVGGDIDEFEGAQRKPGLCANASSEIFSKLSYY